MIRRPPTPTLFPYTTLFRSASTITRYDPPCESAATPLVMYLKTYETSVKRSAPTMTHAIEMIARSEEHTSELQLHVNLVCRLLLEKKKKKINKYEWR